MESLGVSLCVCWRGDEKVQRPEARGGGTQGCQKGQADLGLASGCAPKSAGNWPSVHRWWTVSQTTD